MSRRGPAPVVAATVLLAAVVTLPFLGQPPGLTFDEVHYVPDARAILAQGVEAGFAVHPPVGKWVLAAGIALVGDTEVGWRLPGALLAIGATGLVTLLTCWLTRRRWAGLLAGGLVAVDGVWLVQARTAMLDTPMAALVVAGVTLLVWDHRRHPDDAAAGSRLRRRWPLLLAGACFGLAVATKWSAGLALVGGVLLAAGWETAALRRHGGLGVRAGVRAAVPVVVGLVVVPAVVYALAWAPWLAAYPRTDSGRAWCDAQGGDTAACPAGVWDRIAALGRHHREVLRFHLELDADHPYRAPATTWPVQARPVVYAYDACPPEEADANDGPCVVPPGTAREVLGVGNPVLWWSSLLLLPVAAGTLRRRDGAAVVPLVLLAVQFLPWLAVARPVFSFYAVPLVPFLAVGAAVAVASLEHRARHGATVAAAAAAAATLAGTATLLGATLPGVATAALVGAVAGAAAGGVVDDRRERSLPPPRARRSVAGPLAVTLALLAVTAFGYFAPVWYGLPAPQHVVQQRWWFPSWV